MLYSIPSQANSLNIFLKAAREHVWTSNISDFLIFYFLPGKMGQLGPASSWHAFFCVLHHFPKSGLNRALKIVPMWETLLREKRRSKAEDNQHHVIETSSCHTSWGISPPDEHEVEEHLAAVTQDMLTCPTGLQPHLPEGLGKEWSSKGPVAFRSVTLLRQALGMICVFTSTLRVGLQGLIVPWL